MNVQGSFDITSLKPGSRIAIVGRLRRGKTTLAREVIKTFKQGCRTVIQCHYLAGAEYLDIVERKYIHNNEGCRNRTGVIKNLLAYHKTPNSRDTLFVSDDFRYSKEDWSSDEMKTLLGNDRNHNNTSLFTFSFVDEVPPDMRLMFDYVLIFAEHYESVLQCLYSDYGSCFSSFEVFKKEIDVPLEDHTCVVIDRTKPSPRAFYYKARI